MRAAVFISVGVATRITRCLRPAEELIKILSINFKFFLRRSFEGAFKVLAPANCGIFEQTRKMFTICAFGRI